MCLLMYRHLIIRLNYLGKSVKKNLVEVPMKSIYEFLYFIDQPIPFHLEDKIELFAY